MGVMRRTSQGGGDQPEVVGKGGAKKEVLYSTSALQAIFNRYL